MQQNREHDVDQGAAGSLPPGWTACSVLGRPQSATALRCAMPLPPPVERIVTKHGAIWANSRARSEAPFA